MALNNDILKNLTEAERKEVLRILKDKAEGNHSSYMELLKKDYEEIPVDIETFLRDPLYLGKGLVDDEGRFTVFPYWLETLKKLYPDPLKPAQCRTFVESGAIGLGKSFVAVLIGLYELYRMMCLKNPYVYYGLQEIDTITFAVMNITMDAAKGVAWDKLQQLVQLSPWFLDRGTLGGTTNREWRPPKGIELLYGSQSRHIIGRAVYWCFFDEISFIPNQDVEKQKEKAKTLINTAAARMQSRFMRNGKNPTILVLASSKRTEQSFLESYIEQKRRQDSKSTWVIDEPQWVIRAEKNTPEKFCVAIGNKFLVSEVLPVDADDELKQMYRDRGYQLLEVPLPYYENFIDDIDVALTDIAGISTTSSSRYISGARLKETKDETILNAFTQDVIEVGNGLDDTTQYWEFFDMNRIPKEMIDRPMFVHLDMSISGDKTGIAGVWIKGTKQHTPGEPESRDGVFQPAFSVSIKAPKGHQISFEKNRQFIYWLKEQGFAVKRVSSDTFQSFDLLQALQARNYETDIVSVDRLTDHVCLPYQFLKSCIYEKRLVLYDKCDLLTDELIGLERDNNTGKVDHSPSGINSKDQADALCGAVWNASAYIGEFNFNYGEMLDVITEVSQPVVDEKNFREQFVVDFEQELQRASTMVDSNTNGSTSEFVPYDDSYFYSLQGILL